MPTLRITYRTPEAVRADLTQMAHGGVLVKGPGASDLVLDAPSTSSSRCPTAACSRRAR